jgi:hypothetical protein
MYHLVYGFHIKRFVLMTRKKEIVIAFPLISPSAAFTGKHATLDK